jgi:hypothetical protein
MAQGGQHMLRKHKALSSNRYIAKKNADKHKEEKFKFL